jgi:hypothetical protein
VPADSWPRRPAHPKGLGSPTTEPSTVPRAQQPGHLLAGLARWFSSARVVFHCLLLARDSSGAKLYLVHSGQRELPSRTVMSGSLSVCAAYFSWVVSLWTRQPGVHGAM